MFYQLGHREELRLIFTQSFIFKMKYFQLIFKIQNNEN